MDNVVQERSKIINVSTTEGRVSSRDAGEIRMARGGVGSE